MEYSVRTYWRKGVDGSFDAVPDMAEGFLALRCASENFYILALPNN
jgi:hypothetical protein